MNLSYFRRAWNAYRVADTSARRVRIPSGLRPPQPAHAIRRVCFVDALSDRRHKQSSVSPEFSGHAPNPCNSWSIGFVARIYQKTSVPLSYVLTDVDSVAPGRQHAAGWGRLSGRGESP